MSKDSLQCTLSPQIRINLFYSFALYCGKYCPYDLMFASQKCGICVSIPNAHSIQRICSGLVVYLDRNKKNNRKALFPCRLWLHASAVIQNFDSLSKQLANLSEGKSAHGFSNADLHIERPAKII